MIWLAFEISIIPLVGIGIMIDLTDLKIGSIVMRFGIEVVWVVKNERYTVEGFIIIGISVLEWSFLWWCLCVLRRWIKE